MDIFTQEKRSEIMSAVKGKDTKPEVMLRKALFGHFKNGKTCCYLVLTKQF